MASKDPSADLSPDYWKPPNFEEGQKRINGQLCRVDQKLINIIRQLISELAKSKALPKGDLKKIDALLDEASEISGKVAHIKPPGCEPPYAGDPKWPASSS